MEHKSLLPVGFRDILNERASLRNQTTNLIQQFFSRYGYELVCPPLVEFEENLLVDTGKSLEQNTFRLLDPLSHKMMGVRSDITPQIARIAASRLNNFPKPLRLSYVGDVLRVKNDAGSRQLSQAGIELIGSKSINADLEVISLICRNILALGIEDIAIDFSLPVLTDAIIAGLNLDLKSESTLKEYIRKKDIDGIAKIAGEGKDVLLALNETTYGVQAAIEALDKIAVPESVQGICNDFKNIITTVSERFGSKVSITIDLLEYRYSSYHTGICFAVFSTSKRKEIATGGRYEFSVSESGNVEAVGGTLYIDSLLSSIDERQETTKRIYLPLDTSCKIVSELHAEDYVTIRALEDATDDVAAAKDLQCGYVYRDGQVVAV